MKKIKFLFPVLTGCAATATITPIVTSCGVLNNKTFDTALEVVKALSLGKIGSQYNDACARQPEMKSKLTITLNLIVPKVETSTYYAQALGYGYLGGYFDAAARQPEANDKLQMLALASCQLMLENPSEIAISIGRAAPYEAIGRQPEIADVLIGQYLSYCYEIINNPKK